MQFFFGGEGERKLSFYLALAVLELSNSKRSPILPPKCWIKDKYHYARLKLLYKEHEAIVKKYGKEKDEIPSRPTHQLSLESESLGQVK